MPSQWRSIIAANFSYGFNRCHLSDARQFSKRVPQSFKADPGSRHGGRTLAGCLRRPATSIAHCRSAGRSAQPLDRCLLWQDMAPSFGNVPISAGCRCSARGRVIPQTGPSDYGRPQIERLAKGDASVSGEDPRTAARCVRSRCRPSAVMNSSSVRAPSRSRPSAVIDRASRIGMVLIGQ